MKKIFDVSYNRFCKLDMYLPDTNEPYPVLIHFHGGGLENGCRKDEIYPDLTEKGIGFITCDYRMYPDAHFPDFIEDAAQAIAYVMEYGKQNNLFSKIFVSGSSAGAYLSQMLYFDTHYFKRQNIVPDSINGWIFNAGQPTVHFNVLRERGEDPRLVRIDPAAPIYFVGQNLLPQQPKLLFLVADNDREGRLEQTQLLLATMKQYSYDMKKMELRVMNGYHHCEYVRNKSFFTNLIADFILN